MSLTDLINSGREGRSCVRNTAVAGPIKATSATTRGPSFCQNESAGPLLSLSPSGWPSSQSISREGNSRGYAPLQQRRDFRAVPNTEETNTSERLRRRGYRQVIQANVLADLSEKWLGKFLEFLLSDAADFREFAFALWTCPRHLAQCSIRKDDVGWDVTLISNLPPQSTQTLEEFFVAFNCASPRPPHFLRRCLDRFGQRHRCAFL